MKFKDAFHPYLFAIYAVIGIYQTNANDIPPVQIIRPVLVLTLSSVLINFLLNSYFKNIYRSALITSLLIFWGIFFGHVYRFASNFQQFRNIPEHRTVAVLMWTVAIGSFALPSVWRAFKNPALLTKALNIASASLLVIPAIILSLVVRETIVQKEIMEERQASQRIFFEPETADDPDIYYIILDGYGRQDVLTKYFDYDNSEFVEFLSDKGFYVADNSQSNYMMTHLSLSSSLNFEYLNDLEERFGNSANRGPYSYMIENNRLVDTLSTRGYQFVNIESAVMFMRFKEANIYLSPSETWLNELELLLLTTSAADAFIEEYFPEISLINYDTHRQTLEFQFDALAESTHIEGKKIVFTHILAPHPPFVFDADGNPINPDRPYFAGDANAFFGDDQEYAREYAGEIAYINKSLEKTITSIMEQSKTLPVIIIQSDHGSGLHTSFVNIEETCFDERFSILNAYYFPDGDYSGLTEDITPVNSFRVIMNKYFGSGLEMLENRYYYVTWLKPYQYVDVTGMTDKECSIP